jgi:hypothetical protein
VLEVEIDQNGDGNDGKVDGESKPGEKGALVCAMIAGIGRDVGK